MIHLFIMNKFIIFMTFFFIFMIDPKLFNIHPPGTVRGLKGCSSSASSSSSSSSSLGCVSSMSATRSKSPPWPLCLGSSRGCVSLSRAPPFSRPQGTPSMPGQSWPGVSPAPLPLLSPGLLFLISLCLCWRQTEDVRDVQSDTAELEKRRPSVNPFKWMRFS